MAGCLYRRANRPPPAAACAGNGAPCSAVDAHTTVRRCKKLMTIVLAPSAVVQLWMHAHGEAVTRAGGKCSLTVGGGGGGRGAGRAGAGGRERAAVEQRDPDADLTGVEKGGGRSRRGSLQRQWKVKERWFGAAEGRRKAV